MIKIKINSESFLDSLKSTCKFANSYRYDDRFNRIFYRFKKTVFTAFGTDGRILSVYRNKFAINSYEGYEKGFEFSIPSEEAKLLINILNFTTVKLKGFETTITLKSIQNLDYLTIECLDYKFSFRSPIIESADFLKVVPKKGTGDKSSLVHTTLDIRYVNRIVTAFKIFGHYAITVEFFGEMQPIIFTSSDVPEFMIVLMPMHSDGPSKLRDEI